MTQERFEAIVKVMRRLEEFSDKQKDGELGEGEREDVSGGFGIGTILLAASGAAGLFRAFALPSWPSRSICPCRHSRSSAVPPTAQTG